MNGDGRADYVSIDPDTARAIFWQNDCKPLTFPGDSLCKWDVDDPNSWHLSGAADYLVKIIETNGTGTRPEENKSDMIGWLMKKKRADDWVKQANNWHYVGGSGSTDCWNLHSNGCQKPDRCSDDYNPISCKSTISASRTDDMSYTRSSLLANNPDQ